MLRALVLLALVVAGSIPCGVARAQDADALLDEGVALREEGRDAEALARFEQAYAQTPTPRALAQIALAEQALGRFALAEQHLQAALASSEDRFVRRHQELLAQALVDIQAQIGELAIEGGVPGATVVVDGAERGTLPLASTLRVDHGAHRVEVSAEGHRPFSGEVEVAAGARAAVVVVLEPVERARGPLPDDPPSASAAPGWMVPAGAAIAGAGAIGLGVGIGLAVVREDHAQARVTCSDVDPACRDRYQAALDAEAGAIASFVIGGVLAAGGAVLLVLGLLDGGDDGERAVACVLGVLGIACSGRF